MSSNKKKYGQGGIGDVTRFLLAPLSVVYVMKMSLQAPLIFI